MKALVVTPYYYPKIGGLENYARQLSLTLKNQEQWGITVVTSKAGWRSQRAMVDGHPVYRLGTWFKLSNTPFNPLWPFQIRRIITRERPNVIMAHAPVPSLADAALLAKGKTPFILVYHAATLLKAGSPLFNMAVRIYNLIGSRTLRQSDKIFAVSDFVRQQFAPAVRAKAVVVANAVHANEIVPRRQPAKPEFVFIASLDRSHAWKGLGYILRAVAVYTQQYGRDVRLTIIGDGTMRADYERMVASLGISRQVHFVGAQVGDAKVRYLRRAMGMIMYPTTENDAFPTVMLEAWAKYVPVIGARIGAVATLIHDRKDGLLCNPKDPASLAAAMYRLVAMDEASRSKLAHTAAERTRRSYTWERQARQVCREVRTLI